LKPTRTGNCSGNELHQKCIGKDAGVVIGAAFNIAQTAIDKMLNGERH